MGSGHPLVPNATGRDLPVVAGTEGSLVRAQGSPIGEVGLIHLPWFKETPAGCDSVPNTPKSPPFPFGPACVRSIVADPPTFTAALLFEFRSEERRVGKECRS